MLSPAFEITSLDEGEGGTTRIRTTLEMTSAFPHSLSETVLCRLASHFIISRLGSDAIREACETLSDIYVWETKRLSNQEGPMWESVPGSPTVVNVERPPFLFDE
jgi:hypothetical protein